MNPPREDEPDRDVDFSDPAEDESERWDADDERRQRDCFAPPKEPCECWCLHCRRTFMSDQMWFQRVINARSGLDGFWMCATSNCDGKGFTFDIFPTDPDHPANAGWVDDDDGGDRDDAEDDAEDDPQADYDADETKYKQLDEDDDLEGEEWKHGLQPGEQLPEPEWAEESRRAWEDEQKQYDEPDRRPRVVDWSERDEPQGEATGEEDDIPY